MIDHHNWICQDDLKLERKIGTQTWDKRVGLLTFGIVAADTCKLCTKCTGNTIEMKDKFFAFSAEAMTDNDCDGLLQPPTRTGRARVSESPTTAHGDSSSGTGSHLTPAKRRR